MNPRLDKIGRGVAVVALGALLLVWVGLGSVFPPTRGGAPGASSPEVSVVGDDAKEVRDAVSEVSAARRLLQRREPDEAARYLRRAESRLEVLRDGPQRGRAVTLYSLFDLPGDPDARLAVRSRLQRLDAAIRQGEHQRVIAALTGSGLAMRYRYLDLPVGSAAGDVSAALAALGRREYTAAGADLDRLLQRMHETTVPINGGLPTPPAVNAELSAAAADDGRLDSRGGRGGA